MPLGAIISAFSARIPNNPAFHHFPGPRTFRSGPFLLAALDCTHGKKVTRRRMSLAACASIAAPCMN